MAKRIELKPIREEKAYFDKIEMRIKAAFRKLIYQPIYEEIGIPLTSLQNSFEDLAKALRSGKVTFYHGSFAGKFAPLVAREIRAIGGKWDPKTSTFKILQRDLPPDILNIVGASQIRFTKKLEQIDRKLLQILPADFAKSIKLTDLFDRTLWKIDDAFQSSIKGITVAPQLTKEMSAKIAGEWQENMDLWIRDFTEKEIKELRETVMKTAFSGNRYESLVSSIQKSYGVASRKAKFLARQETNLLLAKFKESRYTDSGINEYRWRCVIGSKNHPVRPSHKVLNGKIFRFDDPPVTTEPGQPIRRNNPGEDYNCRCTSIPIVKF